MISFPHPMTWTLYHEHTKTNLYVSTVLPVYYSTIKDYIRNRDGSWCHCCCNKRTLETTNLDNRRFVNDPLNMKNIGSTRNLEVAARGKCSRSLVMRINTMFLGGSSRNLRNVFHASALKASQHSTMKTRWWWWWWELDCDSKLIRCSTLLMWSSSRLLASISFT